MNRLKPKRGWPFSRYCAALSQHSYLNLFRNRISRLVYPRLIILSIFALCNCTYADASDTQCHYLKFAEFPFELVNNRVVVHGAVNAQSTPILIDSASNMSALTTKGSEQFGLSLIHSGWVTTGVGGESETFTAMVSEIDLDKYHIKRHMDVLVLTDSGSLFNFSIGADFLFNQYVELSFSDMQIRFFKPTNCENTQLGYWGKDVSEIPLLQTRPKDHRQFINVEVNGHTLSAMIDTGYPTSRIDLAAARRVGVTVDSPQVKQQDNLSENGKSDRKSWIAKFDTFAIGDELIKNPAIVIADMWGPIRQTTKSLAILRSIDDQPDMVLGVDFLKAHRILISPSQRTMYFSYLGGAVFDHGN